MKLFAKVKEWFKGLFKKQAVKTLSQIVVGKLALSPRDICNHRFTTGQVWMRVATRQFELQNKLTCIACSYTFTTAIK